MRIDRRKYSRLSADADAGEGAVETAVIGFPRIDAPIDSAKEHVWAIAEPDEYPAMAHTPMAGRDSFDFDYALKKVSRAGDPGSAPGLPSSLGTAR